MGPGPQVESVGPGPQVESVGPGPQVESVGPGSQDTPRPEVQRIHHERPAGRVLSRMHQGYSRQPMLHHLIKIVHRQALFYTTIS